MPSLEHQGLVEMFRAKPALAPHLLGILFHIEVPEHASVRVADSALDQIIPIEFRADLVLELRDARGAFVLAIVLEAQRDTTPRKKYSWPVYAVVARAERECPTVVLVVAPDAEVAGWASEPIDLGLGLGAIRPLVLGPTTVPELTDLAEAEQEVELAILSAMAHGNGPNGLSVVQAALGALARLDREHAAVYFQIIYEVLRAPIRRALEALVMQRQSEGEIKYPPFLERVYEQGELKGKLEGELKGKLEGELKGKIEGKLEGKLEGELSGKRDVLLRLLARAGITLTADERARIDACADSALLGQWIENVIGAKTAADVLS